MNLDRYDNYDLQILGPQHTESGEPEIKKIGDKFQDNNEFVLHNDLKSSRVNQITDMIQEL